MLMDATAGVSRLLGLSLMLTDYAHTCMHCTLTHSMLRYLPACLPVRCLLAAADLFCQSVT